MPYEPDLRPTLWYSHDEENYTPAGSIEEAIQELDGRAGHIAYGAQTPLKLEDYFDIQRWLEELEDQLYDLANPDGDPIFDLSHEDMTQLQLEVREAIKSFTDRRRLKFHSWSIEFVVHPCPVPAYVLEQCTNCKGTGKVPSHYHKQAPTQICHRCKGQGKRMGFPSLPEVEDGIDPWNDRSYPEDWMKPSDEHRAALEAAMKGSADG